ncbi:hypothetical protein [Saccharopolyspora rosea]|uniref:hypothetical protein n=1 Tax=Saccharopolyspora rosea TaxID=524884 RepID=UPI0021DA5834|nr:hypothetical protein [Saccharopolyspora rosea]
MIAALLRSVLVLLVVAAIFARAARRGARPRHDSGARTYAKRYPLDRLDAEQLARKPHRLGESVSLRGDLADDLALVETRQLPLVQTGLVVHDRDAMARHPGTLRRVLTALEHL